MCLGQLSAHAMLCGSLGKDACDAAQPVQTLVSFGLCRVYMRNRVLDLHVRSSPGSALSAVEVQALN